MKIILGNVTMSERELNAIITREANENDFETAEANILENLAADDLTDLDRRFIRHRIADVRAGTRLQKNWY